MNGQLSKREEQVLALLLAGYMQKQIASELGISESRVQDVKSIIKKKWHVATEIEFILEAIKQGYLKIESGTKDFLASYTTNTSEVSNYSYSYLPSKRRMVRIIID